MHLLVPLLLIPLLAATPARASRYREALMDQVERAVVLPRGAKPLNAYGRNYAFNGHRQVVATYLVPSAPADPSQGCEVMLNNLGSRPCTRKEIAESAASYARGIAAETPAGRRRWFRNSRSLPSIADGGCTQVSVRYDIPTHHIMAVACNGYG